jgi:hypothetical protein
MGRTISVLFGSDCPIVCRFDRSSVGNIAHEVANPNGVRWFDFASQSVFQLTDH